MQYLMAVLRAAGMPFRFRDGVIHRFTADDLAAWARDGGFDVVGIHANAGTLRGVCAMIDAVRQRSAAKVLVGGPGSLNPGAFLEAGADAVCEGEAEDRIVSLVEALADRGDLTAIPGTWVRGPDGTPRSTGTAPLALDLDRLAFPYRSRELVPLYGEPVNPAQRGTYVSVIASRGCPYRCTFCASPAWWGHRVRARSPANVVAEIEAVMADWPRPYVSFVDDVFGQRTEWVREFCSLVRARRLRFAWACLLNPTTFGRRRDETLSAMAAAGCNSVSWGAQSASPAVLANIRRAPREPDELAAAVATCRRLGILTIVTYIFGLPGETDETIAADVHWTARHRPHLADFHPLVVLPHSEIAAEYGDRPVTALTADAIERACARAFRGFYFRPGTVWRLALFVLRRNPGYLLRVGYAIKRLWIHMLVARSRAEA
jgi:radical SAM superfamily enzyme YgiQ (UPF0313 family)